MPQRKHHGVLECWPARGEDAYRRAIALGSTTAGARLDDLFDASDGRERANMPPTPACDGSPSATLEVLAVRRAIRGGNDAWAEGVGPQGRADRFPDYFAEKWLRLLTEEVDSLRQRGMYRLASLQDFVFESVTITASDAAVAQTMEEWLDRTYRPDGSVLRDASGRLHQRYELRLRDGRWKIVDAVIVREAGP
jgi:hypothetical protein